MLSEHEVILKWRALFHGGDVTAGTVDDARALLEQLPFESPLRVRFGNELADVSAHLDAEPNHRDGRQV